MTRASPSPSTAKRKAPTQRFRAHVRGAYSLVENLFGDLKRVLIVALSGQQEECREVILRGKWRYVWAKWAIHVLPVCATIATASLNLHGYFIGVNFRGIATPAAQGIDRLCIQVAAKLLELLVIASLSLMVMDVVRDKLLFGSDGIPFGLLLSNVRFGDISFILSRDFRMGLAGFRKRRTRVSITILVSTCSAIALLIGPSAAVLLTPTYFADWPAGGASFWLSGDLSPSSMKVSPHQRSTCVMDEQFPIENATIAPIVNQSSMSCPWAGYTYIAAELQQQGFATERSVSYIDSTFRQTISLFGWGSREPFDPVWRDGVRMFALASNAVIGAYSRYMAQVNWCSALGSSEALRYRVLNGTKANVRSMVPLVRTQCYISDDHAFPEANRSRMEHGKVLLPFPMLDAESRDTRYFLPVERFNTSEIATKWIAIPSKPSLTSYGALASHYPSAFLFVQNPGLPFSESDVTCTVQASWRNATARADGICQLPTQETTQQAVLDESDQDLMHSWAYYSPTPSSAAKSLGTWHTIHLSPGWLALLTPELRSNTSGYTTLASVIESVWAQHYNASFLPGGDDVYIENFFYQLNTIVASFVVDGLSRLRWGENYIADLNQDHVCDVDSAGIPGCKWIWQSSWANLPSKLLRDRAELRPALLSIQNASLYDLNATVEGYGIRLDGTAYMLALVVLLVHILLVIGHIAYTIRLKFVRGGTSNSWSSLTDILALSLTSIPKRNVLSNTSNGVDTNETLKRCLRVRNDPTVLAGYEKLQLMVSRDDGVTVTRDREYGKQS